MHLLVFSESKRAIFVLVSMFNKSQRTILEKVKRLIKKAYTSFLKDFYEAQFIRDKPLYDNFESPIKKLHTSNEHEPADQKLNS
ncbi:hypothetical protein K1T71_007056 [Dendrolimus kikuchii]|uniref:Uncharacterized protein n=1 Tax=Dendrolimus kikuchii TaxID=765133 RepID=A0ACC1CZL5_9NEOP|nr:hypothetical protein K1T71_007056 [Dendrolimus kikuchii]